MRVRVLDREHLPGISGEPWVDPERRCYIRGSLAYVPVKTGYASDMELGEKHRYGSRGYYMIGDIAVIHGRPPSREVVSDIVRWKNPRAVLWAGPPDGVMRIPKTTVLYGIPGETTHVEGGISYQLDPTAVMFAMGNRVEKERVASFIREGERVADMCAGIGYFSLPMAKAGARVEATEINPVSYRFLVRNVMENGLEGRVIARCGDSRTHLEGIYDRVVIGHFESFTFLPALSSHLKAGSTVHCHILSDDERNFTDGFSRAGYDVRTTRRRVKKYRPHVWHEVIDCEVIA